MAVDFINDQRGNVAMIFGLLAMPIMLCVAVAVDYSRISSAEENMQVSVDNAVKTVEELHSRRIQAEKDIAAMIDANSGRTGADVKISVDEEKLRIEATDWIDTPVLGFVGQPQSEISVTLEMKNPERELKAIAAAEKALLRKKKEQMRQVERKLARLLEKNKRRGYRPLKMSPQEQEKLLRELNQQIAEMHEHYR